MLVIYFNNWFSSISGVIDDIKKRHNDDVKIIGSSQNKYHVMKEVVDEFYVEDYKINGQVVDYEKWLINFIREHKIDIFFPKKNIENIFNVWDDIEELGTYIAANREDAFNSVDSKYQTYKIVETLAKTLIPIPEYIKSSNKDDIFKFLNNHPSCLKLDVGEGGESYKRIVNSISEKSLYYGLYNQITFKDLENIINSMLPKDLNKFLFMEYLESPEVSVDCYNSNKGFIAICRNKIGGTRVQQIFYDEKFTKACQEICRIFKFTMPFNVQFRMKQNGDNENYNDYRLLEINPRMSGGTYYQSLVGLNICDVCLCDMAKYLGIEGFDYDINKYINFDDKLVSHVERGVVLL